MRQILAEVNIRRKIKKTKLRGLDSLLKQKRLRPNFAQCEKGLTVLHWAASNGQLGVVKLLLSSRLVRLYILNDSKSFAKVKYMAKKGGHEVVVKLLEVFKAEQEKRGWYKREKEKPYRRLPNPNDEEGEEKVIRVTKA